MKIVNQIKDKGGDKIKIAVVKLTSCMGCETEISNLGKDFLKIAKHIDFNYFILIKKGKIVEQDVVFVEGAASTKEEVELLKKVRERSKCLIALGTCAVTGGIPALRNYIPEGIKVTPQRPQEVFPLENYVQVDYKLRGCPIIGIEFERVVKDILAGKTLKERNFPVCMECKKLEIECMLNKGVACAGAVTQGGCRAICPLNKVACNGCRGLVKGAEIDSWLETLKKYGINRRYGEEILKIFT